MLGEALERTGDALLNCGIWFRRKSLKLLQANQSIVGTSGEYILDLESMLHIPIEVVQPESDIVADNPPSISDRAS